MIFSCRDRVIVGSYGRGAATSDVVREDGDQDDDAGDDQLPLLDDAHHLHPLAQGLHDEGADDGAEDVGAATGQRGAADDDRGDDVELVADTFSRLDEPETCRVEDGPEGHEQPCGDVDHRLPELDVDTGQAGGDISKATFVTAFPSGNSYRTETFTNEAKGIGKFIGELSADTT